MAAGGGRVVVTDHGRSAGELPLTGRWQVEDGSVTERSVSGPAAPTRATVRVEVANDQLIEVLDLLSARGWDPQVEGTLPVGPTEADPVR